MLSLTYHRDSVAEKKKKGKEWQKELELQDAVRLFIFFVGRVLNLVVI